MILGLYKIIISPDILITDYVELAGIGPTLFNSAITSLSCLYLLIKSKVKPNGSTIMSLWLITGFSFFGKNIFNVWPIIFGVYLYSIYDKKPFLTYTLTALLSTTLAPTITIFNINNKTNPILGLLIGILIGVIIGFIMPSISSYFLRIHGGFNLYNVGFAGGILATLIMSIFRLVGINISTILIWNKEFNLFFSILLYSISSYLIIIGLLYNNSIKENFKKILNEPGRLLSDFYLLFGETCYINMGILGIISTTLILLLRGSLNGATISGIFTIIGFGSLGKTPKNVFPIFIGSILAGLLSTNPINSPSILLGILFATALAPIAGSFGFFSGILAGFLHICTVTNVGYLHGGMNLYNNGLAAGFVTMILIPILSTFKGESN